VSPAHPANERGLPDTIIHDEIERRNPQDHVLDNLCVALSRSLCYMMDMGTKSTTKSRRTTSIPVTTMEEISVPSPKERERLLRSLREAEGRVKAGKGVDYDPKAFKQRLMRIYRGGRA
jgi:hypothetical protein